MRIEPVRRTVAVLDVLGFRQMLESIPLDRFAWRYGEALALLDSFVDASDPRGPVDQAGKLVSDRFVFSDTIILISKTDDEAGCLDVLLMAWRYSQVFLSVGLPLRGGVAFGDMHVDAGRQVFVGQPLTKANDIQMSQEWAGTVIDESVASAFPQLFEAVRNPNDLLSRVFVEWSVPIKPNGHKRAMVVNWRAQLVALDGIESMLPLAADAAATKKRTNTLLFSKEMRARGYAAWNPYPPRLAPLVVGNALVEGQPPPPLVQGDEY